MSLAMCFNTYLRREREWPAWAAMVPDTPTDVTDSSITLSFFARAKQVRASRFLKVSIVWKCTTTCSSALAGRQSTKSFWRLVCVGSRDESAPEQTIGSRQVLL